jgi:ubiquinone/menaquinone biosynthesis C-methylase UbiE
LDIHFESARAEYEEALRFAGIKPGWTVLDAGCGSGGYVPLMCEHVGSTGRVAALDLAPENVAQVERLVSGGRCAAPVDLRVGSVLDLPFADATFDCVWSANLAQYLTKTEFALVMGEFRRVAKPGGLVAVKDFDATLYQFLPLDPAILARLIAARRAKEADTGLLGIACAPLLGPFFRRSGVSRPALEPLDWLGPSAGGSRGCGPSPTRSSPGGRAGPTRTAKCPRAKKR